MYGYGISSALNGYENKLSLVKGKQSVYDIIAEILKAHKEYAPQYDKICVKFDGNSLKKICDNISDFLKKNVPYEMEPEARQTAKSPAAILATKSDCKHYASWAGGCLDALCRRGKNIDWCYRFASYDYLHPDPEHVFVVVKKPGSGEIWIDPTPGADKARPVYIIDKKIKVKNKDMALYRLSGAPAAPISYIENDLYDENDPELINAISLLMSYGVLNDQAKINTKKLVDLQLQVDPETYDRIVRARQTLQSAAMGSIFSKVFKGVKTVGLAAPRAAYLSLVALNVFGLARKLHKAIFKDEAGTIFTDDAIKVRKKWESLGGAFSKLAKAAKSGYKKKAILGAVYFDETRAAINGKDEPAINGPEIPGWVTIASAIIKAMAPLLNAILKNRQAETGENPFIDPETGMQLPEPGNVTEPAAATGGGIEDRKSVV